MAKKSKKAKRGAPARKKKGIKKATPANRKKKPAPKPAPAPVAPSPPLGEGFGGKTEDPHRTQQHLSTNLCAAK